MDNFIDENVINVINNELDCSDIIPTKEAVLYLCKYMFDMGNKLQSLIDENESRNEKLKDEFKTYDYAKTYGNIMEINVFPKNGSYLDYNDYESLYSAANSGVLNKVRKITIKLDLSFKRGTGRNLEEHKNELKITFEPFESSYTRKANHRDMLADKVDNEIKEILSKFPRINSIFFSKE